ncbi:hypothetical protein D3C80_1660880 [compost metagenome]
MRIKNQPIDFVVITHNFDALRPYQLLDLLDRRQTSPRVEHLPVLHHLPGRRIRRPAFPLQPHSHPAGADGLPGNQLQAGDVLYATDGQIRRVIA